MYHRVEVYAVHWYGEPHWELVWRHALYWRARVFFFFLNCDVCTSDLNENEHDNNTMTIHTYLTKLNRFLFLSFDNFITLTQNQNIRFTFVSILNLILFIEFLLVCAQKYFNRNLIENKIEIEWNEMKWNWEEWNWENWKWTNWNWKNWNWSNRKNTVENWMMNEMLNDASYSMSWWNEKERVTMTFLSLNCCVSFYT